MSSLLAKLAASYAVEPAATVKETKGAVTPKVKVSKEKPTALPNKQGEDKLPKQDKSVTSTAPSPERLAHTPQALPTRGALTARQFLVAMRAKGATQQEKMNAIAGFIGWDRSRLYGEQESAAFQAAKRDIHGIDTSGLTREEAKNVNRSVQGFVAGLPDDAQKQVSDLQARERLALSEMSKWDAIAKNEELSDETRAEAKEMANLEQERVYSIGADLAKLLKLIGA